MIGVIDGRKKKVRKAVVPRKRWLSSSAAPSDPKTPNVTFRRANTPVRRSEFQNCSSLKNASW